MAGFGNLTTQINQGVETMESIVAIFFWILTGILFALEVILGSLQAVLIGGFFLASCNPDWVGSPNGTVPQGTAAYSPDGKYYSKEIEPYGQGNIGVFQKKDDQSVWTWYLPLEHNDLKGMAWSPDSNRVALMYHWGSRSQIYVYELYNERQVAQASANGWAHSMKYAKDGKGIYLPEEISWNFFGIPFNFLRLSLYVPLEEITETDKVEGKNENGKRQDKP